MTQQPFTSLLIYPNYQEGHRLEWTIDQFFTAPTPYRFTVEVSESENFNSIIYSKQLGDINYAVDDSGLKDTLSQCYYYRVTLLDGSNDKYYSRVVGLGQIPGGSLKYRQGAEVMRIEQVVQRYCGQAGYLLKRKYYGEVDRTGVDPVTGAVVDDNLTSFGTNLVGGYYPGIPTSWRIIDNMEDHKLNQSGNGNDDIQIFQGRMIGYPKLTGQDILVRTRDDKRYVVSDIHSTFIPGIGLCCVQTFTATCIPVTDTIYSIAMP